MVGFVRGLEPSELKETIARAMWTGDWERMAETAVNLNEKSACLIPARS